MKKQRMCDTGSISKNYSLGLTYENHKRHNGATTEAKVEHTASLSIDFHFNSSGFDPDFWENVLNFQRESNKIIQLARRLMREGTNVNIEYIVSAYEHTPEYTEQTLFGPHKTTLNQVSFNRWYLDSSKHFEGEGQMSDSTEGEDAGFYLYADEQYTRAETAIWVDYKIGFTRSLVEHGASAEVEHAN